MKIVLGIILMVVGIGATLTTHTFDIEEEEDLSYSEGYPLELEDIDTNIEDYFRELEELGLSTNENQNYENYSMQIEPRIAVDGLLTVPQLFKKYGYPVEVHNVQTPDGYLLEMHRLPRKDGIPVMLVHGILDSSAGFVVTGPKKALAYILWDLGYDVWLANCRGNKYSRKHLFLSTKKKAFWDFSFHELGVYDVPAMVDYVLLTTGFDKLHYVAHSQGSTALFVMCDQRPGYCDKILSVNALAPAVYLNHVTSPIIKFFSFFLNQFEFLSKILGMKEFLPNNDILTMAGQVLCKEKAITQSLCSNVFFLICGYDSDQLNKTMLPTILGHVPAGGSVKQLVHFGQLINSGIYRMFDHGWIKNLSKYGKLKPPSYNLTKVTAPVALHYSMNDWLADTRDVLKLSSELPNVIGRYLVPIPKFNHMDFLFGISSKEAVYDQIVKVMKSFEK